MRGSEIRAAWVVLAAVAMVTVPMATAAPGASVEATESVLPGPLAIQPSEDGIGLARQSLEINTVPSGLDEQVDQAHRNLDTAEQVLALTDEDEPSLSQGVEIVQEMSRWQAASTGHAWTPSEQPLDEAASPSGAAFALLDRFDVEPTTEQAERIERLDALPEDVGAALARTIVAYQRLDTVTTGIYNDVDQAKLAEMLERVTVEEDGITLEGSTSDLPDLIGPEIDLVPLLSARADLLAAFDTLEAALVDQPTDHAHVGQIVIPPALALDLAGDDSTYTEDVALSIDVGGNDTYRNNAGGNNLNGADCLPPTPEDLVDLAGAAALLDAAGDDDYFRSSAAYCGLNGAGVFGVGLLVDTAGDDRYGADGASGFGVNGAGVLAGIGTLVDTGGDDLYHAWFTINGGGYGEGLGMLVDTTGHDTYDATWAGVNGGADAGGIGSLVDLRGNDTYDAEVGYEVGSSGANGGAFARGVGFLLDAQGDDTYLAWREGANGGAIHQAVGTLVDASGQDTYGYDEPAGDVLRSRSGSWGFNGGAMHGALGLLTDLSGDDTYDARIVGVNGGAGAAAAVGRLVDASGDDAYTAEYAPANGGAWYDASGLLLDGDGTDTYEEAGSTATDETIVPKNTAGAQIDLPHLPGGLPAS